MVTLKVEPQGAKLSVKRGTRLLDALNKAGAPATAKWATEAGADGYGEDGMEALRIAKQLVAVKK